MITTLLLQNYRRYNNKKILLKSHSLIIGPNGFGKTTTLEAIYWCIYGKSPLTTKLTNVINQRALNNLTDNDFVVTAVEIILQGQSLRRVLKVTKTKEKNYIKTTLYLDGKKTNQHKFQKKLYVGLFSPEYIEILGRDRRQRLNFIDALGKQIIHGYTNILTLYNKIVQNRNKLLKDSMKINQVLLQTYTQRLVDYGKKLVNKRRALLEKLTMLAKNNFPQANKYIYQEVRPLQYTKEILQKELYIKRSLLGPHLDDWEIFGKVKFFPILQLGSRGQKKIAILRMFLIMINAVKNVETLQSIILMDDPTNELDKENSKLFKDLDLSDYQVVETCIGESL